MSPDGSRVYVANNGGSTISVIDTATNTTIGTINVGPNPYRVLVTPDGKQLYVTSAGGNSITAINTATNTITATIAPTKGQMPRDMAISPDGKTLYVGTEASGSTTPDAAVLMINTATNTVTGSVAMGQGTNHLAVSSDGARLYVMNTVPDRTSTTGMDYNISVVNTSTGAVTATIPVDPTLGTFALSPDGTRLYALQAGSSNGSIFVYDTATNTKTGTIAAGNHSGSITVSPDSTTLYVGNAGGAGSVSVIDAATGATTSTVSVGGPPGVAALSPSGKVLYVPVLGGTVSVVSTGYTGPPFPSSGGTGTGTGSGSGSGTGAGSGTGTGSGSGTGTGGTPSSNDAIRAWIDSLGTIADDLHLGVIGPALHVSNIYDDLYQGNIGGALFDTSELIAGGLEGSHLPVVSAFGVLIDVWAQTAQKVATTGPSDPSMVFGYMVQHPISAFGGAVSAVVDVAGNTIGHMVGLPQPWIDGLVKPAVQGINDGSDTVQSFADTVVSGGAAVVQNVVNAGENVVNTAVNDAGNFFNDLAHSWFH